MGNVCGFLLLGCWFFWLVTHPDSNPFELAGDAFYHWSPYLSFCILAVLTGAVLGFFFCDHFRSRRLLDKILDGFVVLFLSLGATLSFVYAFIEKPDLIQAVAFFLGFIIAKKYWAYPSVAPVQPFEPIEQTVYGTSEWADTDYLIRQGLSNNYGYFLGVVRQQVKDATVEIPLHYAGDRHFLTVGPARSGKGVSTIIPNLLTYEGSALVIDPKGENAFVTAARRGKGDAELGIPGMGQQVMIIDPWGIVTDGENAACFNPMDWLDPADPDINENAMILWDSIIMEDDDE